VIAATLTGLLAINIARPWLRPWLTLDLAAFVGWYALTAGAVWSVLRKEESPGLPPEAVTPARSLLDGGAHLDRHDGSLVSPTVTPTPKPATPSGHGRSAVIVTALVVLASSALAVRFRYVAELPRAAFALALSAQLLALVRFLSRATPPDDAQRVALVLVGSSIVDLAPGPWMLGDPVRDWYAGHWPAIVTWLVVAGWEVRCLIYAHRSPE
jgi:hypothetical protein